MEPDSPTRPYSSRIRERVDVWWGKDQSFVKRLHRLRELTRHHHRDDSDAAWRCCPLWQRTLQNKLNGRAFAERHGCRVPRNYWHGRRPHAVPWDRIPAEFVVKPVWGFSSRGAFALSEGRDQITGDAMTRDDLIQTLRAMPPVLWMPLLIEEHVRRPDGSYGEPMEYKFHVFRDQVGAVSFFGRQEKTEAFYTTDWDQLPPISPLYRPASAERPDCLDEMMELAVRLGRAYGTYVRVDFFWTDRGCLFNELASVPALGEGLTDFADEFFTDCWEEMLERSEDDPSEELRVAAG